MAFRGDLMRYMTAVGIPKNAEAPKWYKFMLKKKNNENIVFYGVFIEISFVRGIIR